MKKRVLNSLLITVFVFCYNTNAQWIHVNSPNTKNFVSCFAVSGSNVFAGTYYESGSGGSSGGLYLTTNNGDSWTFKGMSIRTVKALVFSGTRLFVGTEGTNFIPGGISLTTNNGNNWESAGHSGSDVNALAVSSAYILAGTSFSTASNGNAGVYYFEDQFRWWFNAGLTTSQKVTSLAVSGNNVFAGSYGEGVFLSTQKGVGNWTSVNNGLTDKTITALAVSENNIFAGTLNNGVFRSTNSGGNWTSVNSGIPTITTVESLVFSGSNLFAGTSSGVYLTINNGDNWTSVSSGMSTATWVFALALSANNLLAGTSTGVWRRPLSQLITGVEERLNNFPTTFVLEQNHPNPFNPTTTIKYSIPAVKTRHGESLQNVTLKVYDILGSEITTLVNEAKAPGNYEIKLDGSKLSSGVYFYRLQAGQFNETKKFILMK